MPFRNDNLSAPENDEHGDSSVLRVQLRAFQIPPIRDAALVGRAAPVSGKVLAQTLRLMCPETFVGFAMTDDTIAWIFVRKAILRRISVERIKTIVLRKIKPLMGKTEILTLDMDIEIILREALKPQE